MTWESKRPIYNRLPKDSGAWNGNEVVDILTGFWDDLLVEHYQNITTPTDWLGSPETGVKEYYLDWVGYALCGYGSVWNYSWDGPIKRRMIRDWVQVFKGRGGLTSSEAIVKAILPSARVATYDQPRVSFDLVGAAYLGQSDPTLYHILVPKDTTRNSAVWVWLEDILTQFLPIGSGHSRVQYQDAMTGLSVVGDSVGSSVSIGYNSAN